MLGVRPRSRSQTRTPRGYHDASVVTGVFSMAYLSNSIGILSGVLPAPHHAVRIEVGPLGGRVFVAYSGTAAALVACGAVEPGMLAGSEGDAAGVPARDSRLRPYRRETLPDGRLRFTRHFASLAKVRDLPGIGGPHGVGTGVLRSRMPRLRLVHPTPEDAGS